MSGVRNIILLIGVLLAVILMGAASYLIITDNLVYWAKQDNPLGKEQIYIIQKNMELRKPDGSLYLPAGMFYTFFPLHEKRQSSMSSGRQIGSTTVGLEQYLDKEVYIYGYFSEGNILLLQSDSDNLLPDTLINRRVILNIEKIEPLN